MDFKLKTFDTPINVTRIANIHYFEFANQYQTTFDSHDFAEIVYVKRGKLMVTSSNYRGFLTKGNFIIHEPNETHALSCIENSTAILIIGFECKSEFLESFSKRPTSLSSLQEELLSTIMSEGMSVFAPPYDIPNMADMKKKGEYPFAADQMVKIKLEEFLISLVRGRQKFSLPEIKAVNISNNTLADIHAYLTEHFTENILLDNICFLFGTNKTSLCRDFKNEYGITVLNYIKELKVDAAKKLLKNKNTSITDISAKLGFGSIHYFCRFFKKETGYSPNEFAKLSN